MDDRRKLALNSISEDEEPQKETMMRMHMTRWSKWILGVCVASAGVWATAADTSSQEPVMAQVVNAVERLPDGKRQPYEYKFLKKAERPWRIGVSVPHLKDAYWLAVNYGIMEEGKALGVHVRFLAANGYTDITGQVNALNDLVTNKVDAILVGAINAKSMGPQLRHIRDSGIPVIGIINPISVDDVTAARYVSFVDSGFATGEYVKKAAGGKEAVVALFPGPGGSGWAEDEAKGFEEATKGVTSIKIVAIKYGDTNKATQQNLVENVMLSNPKINYIVGNPPAALAATTLGKLTQGVTIVANIASPPVVDEIEQGKIAMTPTDWTVQLARMSIDTAVRVLQGEKVPASLGTKVGTIDTDSVKTFKWDEAFAPKGFKPIFNVSAK